MGPVRFFRRTVTRLNSVGWFRAAGSLSFVTLLGLVPLATVAFAFVAQFPIFQDFLQVLERFLLRHLLPASASAVVHEYVVVLAADAANVVGRSIVFVAVTAALAIDTIESEINEIWGVRKKRPIARRILVYLFGITVGPVILGATISLIGWTLAEVVATVPIQRALTDVVRQVLPTALVIVGLTLLYRIAPARHVLLALRHCRRRARRHRVRSHQARLHVVPDELPELRNALRRAGSGSGADVLDLPDLADRACGRGRGGNARGSRRARK